MGASVRLARRFGGVSSNPSRSRMPWALLADGGAGQGGSKPAKPASGGGAVGSSELLVGWGEANRMVGCQDGNHRDRTAHSFDRQHINIRAETQVKSYEKRGVVPKYMSITFKEEIEPQMDAASRR